MKKAEKIRQEYVDKFPSIELAGEFELQALSNSNLALPDFVKKVYEGGEPTTRYWKWLLRQVRVKSTNFGGLS